MNIGRSFPDLVCFSIVLASLSYAPKASADQESTDSSSQEVALAEDYASQAFNAYQNKDYANAVALYLEAYELAANADILYNIAKIYDVGLRDRPLAINFYRRYIVDPGAVPERIKTANERLAQLRAAEEASLESFPVRTSNQPSAQTARTEPSEIQSPATDTNEETPSDLWSTTRILGLVTGIAGIAALSVGAGFGIAAMSDAEITKLECDGKFCETQDAVDAAKSGKTKADISTVGFSLGGGLIAVGVVLWVLGSDDSERETDESLAIRLQPLVLNSDIGLSALGRW